MAQQIYRVSKFAYYDPRQQRAYSAYKVDRRPDSGPLVQLICQTRRAYSRMDWGVSCDCENAIKNPSGCGLYEFVRWETLPVFLSWLTNNGYTILPSLSEVVLRDCEFLIQGP